MIKSSNLKGMYRFERTGSYLSLENVGSSVNASWDPAEHQYFGDMNDAKTLVFDIHFDAGQAIPAGATLVSVVATGYQDPQFTVRLTGASQFETLFSRDSQATNLARAIGSTVVTTNTIYRVGVVLNNGAAGKVQLYVNGVLEAEDTMASSDPGTSVFSSIGLQDWYGGLHGLCMFNDYTDPDTGRPRYDANPREAQLSAGNTLQWSCEGGEDPLLGPPNGTLTLCTYVSVIRDEFDQRECMKVSVADQATAHQGFGYEFDGTGYILQLTAGGGAYDIRTALTVGMWIKGFESTLENTFAGRWFSIVSSRVWKMAVVADVLQVKISGDNTEDLMKQYDGTTELDPDTAYHVAFTYENDVLKLYINGVEEAVTKTVDDEMTTLSSSNVPLIFGADLTIDNFSGVIDEFCMFDRVLSESDIKRIMLGFHPIAVPPLPS